jgi:hypothetical protein
MVVLPINCANETAEGRQRERYAFPDRLYADIVRRGGGRQNSGLVFMIKERRQEVS